MESKACVTRTRGASISEDGPTNVRIFLLDAGDSGFGPRDGDPGVSSLPGLPFQFCPKYLLYISLGGVEGASSPESELFESSRLSSSKKSSAAPKESSESDPSDPFRSPHCACKNARMRTKEKMSYNPKIPLRREQRRLTSLAEVVMLINSFNVLGPELEIASFCFPTF